VSRDFFAECEAALLADKESKLRLTEEILAALQAGAYDFHESTPPKNFDRPSCADFCEAVSPFAVKRRTNLASVQGKGIFLHAIAHIEYSAIDLALDAAYRFRNLPEDFYRDWIVVAEDEVRHFRMLESLMAKTGTTYGDYPVHLSLFEASQKSPTLLARMAAVPRYLEAGGLDANPRMMERLRQVGDELSLEIVEALQVILDEEIDHVKKGDRWFKYACLQEGKDESIYFDLIEAVLPGSSKKKEFINAPARLEAGFSCKELKRISGEENVCEEEA